MTPRAVRIVVPIVVGAIAIGLVLIMVFTKPPAPSAPPGGTGTTPSGQPTPETGDGTGTSPAEAADGADDAGPSGAAGTGPESTPAVPGARETLEGLVAVAPADAKTGHDTLPTALGGLDAQTDVMRVEFDRAGAGIDRIAFADIWVTAEARRDAADPNTPAPDESLRYVLDGTRLFRSPNLPDGLTAPVLAATRVWINGTPVDVFDFNPGPDGPAYIWGEVAPGTFVTIVRDGDGRDIARITRRFTLGTSYDLGLEQTVENLTSAPIDVVWSQYGPGDLMLDRSRYMDRRRYRVAWLDPARNPARNIVITDEDGGSGIYERSSVRKFDPDEVLWPTEVARDHGYELAWFGSTNRYFTVTVHPFITASGVPRSLELTPVERVLQAHGDPQPGDPEAQETIFTYLFSPERGIAPGATLDLSVGVYAGPLDRHVLEEQPYATLGMDRLILYQMSSCCSQCTFQWLAHLLLGFLTLLHQYVLFDWALAIIALVVVVRTLLHPIAKRGQISMHRFGRQMSAMKPELDKIQKKYANDKQKLQQEQMRLMREHGVNPMRALGCVPMLLQTPIWIALYATLYFVWDLRQQPAFFGLFQKISGGHWHFLADLSAADHCFYQFAEPFRFAMWNVTGINVLPVLMGVMFFLQQKYLSPPPSAAMTEDQMRTQKMMRVIMPIMFPLMLYSAPSGLTLYIMTSSTLGIIEGRYIRKHINELDSDPIDKRPADRRGAKPKDAQGRAYAAALQRMEEKRRLKAQGPPRKFKKRK